MRGSGFTNTDSFFQLSVPSPKHHHPQMQRLLANRVVNKHRIGTSWGLLYRIDRNPSPFVYRKNQVSARTPSSRKSPEQNEDTALRVIRPLHDEGGASPSSLCQSTPSNNQVSRGHPYLRYPPNKESKSHHWPRHRASLRAGGT